MASNNRFQEMPKDAATANKLAAELKYGPPVGIREGVILLLRCVGVLVMAAIFLGLFKGCGRREVRLQDLAGHRGRMPGFPGSDFGPARHFDNCGQGSSHRGPAKHGCVNAQRFCWSGDSREMAQRLLGAIDIFSFWDMILLAIGYCAAAPKKLSTGKAFAWIFSVWLIYVLIKVGLTAAVS